METPEKLITENLDLWTSAVKDKSSAGRGAGKKRELYGIQKLRELILGLAVRGLLVPQDLSDAPASEALKQAAAERTKLQKAKLIKSITPAPIDPVEHPHKIPETWCWARFPELCHYSPGKTPSTKNPSFWEGEQSGSGIPWVSIADMEHFGTVTQTSKQVTELAAEKVFKSEAVKAGTILMSFKLTVGKIARLATNAYHNEAILSVTPFNGILDDYIFKFLPMRALAGNTKKAIMGNTLNATSLGLLLIPLPPLAEQHRIVAKVDELMALCDQLEQEQESSLDTHDTLVATLLGALTAATADASQFAEAWQRIQANFDTLFTTESSIDQLKQTILQLAIMGKLVPQDPEDSPASEVLKSVEKEKEKLVKDGKIRRPRKPQPFSEDELKYELPTSWKWVRFGSIAAHNAGKTLDRRRNTGDLRKYLTTSNLYWGRFDLTDVREMQIREDELQKCTARKNDLLICEGGEAGRAAVWRDKAEICFQNHIHRARLYGDISPFFAFRFFEWLSATGEIDKYRKGVGISNMSGKALASIPFPLPPLAEQKRIVAKVDELMALCDQLKASLASAQATQLNLADSLVEQAIA